MKAFFFHLSSQEKYKFFLEKGKRYTFGAGEGNDIVLPLPGISQFHGVLLREEEGIKIFDLQSTNGIYIKKNKILQDEIKNNDQVVLGSQVFIFKFQDTKKLPIFQTNKNIRPSYYSVKKLENWPSLTIEKGVLVIYYQNNWPLKSILFPQNKKLNLKKIFRSHLLESGDLIIQGRNIKRTESYENDYDLKKSSADLYCLEHQDHLHEFFIQYIDRQKIKDFTQWVKFDFYLAISLLGGILSSYLFFKIFL